ncbi:hypothetical protein AKJ51_04090 [candidate division MSBL1 archaeon SCGC-AAA382A20]|uniref:PIN domain-containing protein n=1 Tax=candidate division MSBL1 archaeon SCGC-AAA382A20 TaxID=1698280 RepID=A0A133VIA4_9EURY|nr:hypothetical protein AKJ51_04090 [candidate division MSBL1 archaeon SCGC-AAA382A20]
MIMNLFADTNIFGIAVDSNDDRRKSVWETLDSVAAEEIELHTTKLVEEKIQENPHQPTREKELKLLENLTTKIHPFDEEAKELSEELERQTSLDVADSQIVSIAIINEITFWSGGLYLLREKTITEINEVLSEKEYEFQYKKEESH